MDHTYKAASLTAIGVALTALQASGLVNAGSGPANMLGSLSVDDSEGNPLFRYGIGSPPGSFTDPEGNTVETPGSGEAGMFYVAIRADVLPADIPFNPADLGMIFVSPEESAAVLGVWAGHHEPYYGDYTITETPTETLP